MQYNFPPVKFTRTNTIQQQIDHISEEYTEFIREVNAGRMGLADAEAMDLLHSLETYMRMRQVQGIDVKAVLFETREKNFKRGYYFED